MTERAVAEKLDVRVTRDGGETWKTIGGALGWGASRPFELILGFGGLSLVTPWVTWVVDVSVAVAGIYCSPSSPAGRGDVQIYRHSATRIAVRLIGVDGTNEVHYDFAAFRHFVARVTDIYEDPAPLADDVLAAQLEEWRTK